MEFSATGPIVDSNCSNFSLSGEEQHTVIVITLAASSFGAVVTVFAIITLLLFKSYHLFFRIILYFLIANMFQIFAHIFSLFPIVNKNGENEVRHGYGWTSICRGVGFLEQVAVWMGHLSMLWLVLYVVDLIRAKKRLEKAVLSRKELVGIGVCFFFPFVFNWIPFMDDYYGFSGSWCWIKASKAACSDSDVADGLAFMVVMNFLPLLFLVVLNTFLCALIFAIWCMTRSHMKEVAFVIVYPLVFDALFILVTICRINSTLRTRGERTQSYALWVTHAVAESSRLIFPSLLAILQWTSPLARQATKTFRSEGVGKDRVQDGDMEKKCLMNT